MSWMADLVYQSTVYQFSLLSTGRGSHDQGVGVFLDEPAALASSMKRTPGCWPLTRQHLSSPPSFRPYVTSVSRGIPYVSIVMRQ